MLTPKEGSSAQRDLIPNEETQASVVGRAIMTVGRVDLVRTELSLKVEAT